MPGVELHPQPCVRMEEAHKQRHYRYSRNPRHSLRDGVNGCFVISPVSVTS